PALLLFEDDLQRRQETTATFLEAQAHAGLGRRAMATGLLRTVLQRDPSHGPGIDLLRELGTSQGKANTPVGRRVGRLQGEVLVAVPAAARDPKAKSVRRTAAAAAAPRRGAKRNGQLVS